jgi:hypothetical protein
MDEVVGRVEPVLFVNGMNIVGVVCMAKLWKEEGYN